MNLPAYFDRIGYSGPRTPDFATLDALMRAHAAHVPFENLDVQLGRRLSLDRDAIFAKLVGARRGGWCYEQNGLFGWALGELGFDVRRLSCGVLRAVNGDAALGNHLALAVTLEGAPWLVDVGFGGSQAGPIPLAAGEHSQAPYTIALAQHDDGFWRLAEWTEPNKPFSFDFRDGPADEPLLAAKCAELQDDPESVFVQNLVVQQRLGDTHRSLRGRVFSERSAAGETRHVIGNAAEFVGVLADAFALDLPEAAGLWDKVCARHETLFPAGAKPLSA
jgi:N-hydroxyarylamine O-acetyltransferase